MINSIIRSLIYFVVFVLLQVLVLNNIHFLRVVTPFLYVYFIIKLPVGISRMQILILSFVTGLIIDAFSNTPGMHAAACTFAGFVRDPLITRFFGKDFPEGIFPSFRAFGYGGFFKYVFFLVIIHHTVLFLVESVTLLDPLFFLIRVLGSVAMTSLLVCTVEAFNMETQKSAE